MKWKNIPKDIESYWGYIYEITNLETNRKYIGRKHFWRIEKKPPLKGKKNKRHFKKETDWKEYWGSSEKLLEDIEKFGKRKFTREIIYLCETKWDCAYHEARIQFEKEVLLKEEFYNGIINLRIPAKKRKLYK